MEYVGAVGHADEVFRSVPVQADGAEILISGVLAVTLPVDLCHEGAVLHCRELLIDVEWVIADLIAGPGYNHRPQAQVGEKFLVASPSADNNVADQGDDS